MEQVHPNDASRLSGASTDEQRTFWQVKTLSELAAEQGLSPVPDFDALLGRGKDLWTDDAEFDAFLTDLAQAAR